MDRFPSIRGKGDLEATLAVCEMLALVQKVPFRRDAIQKILEDQFRRDKKLTLELLGGLAEGMGLRTQLGSVQKKFVGSIEPPAILLIEDIPIIVFEITAEYIVIGNPEEGVQRLDLSEFQAKLDDQVRFAIRGALVLPQQVGLAGIGLLLYWVNIANP